MYFTSQNKWLTDYGDIVWDIICDNTPTDCFWKLQIVVPEVAQQLMTTVRQASTYIRLVLQNVIAEYQTKKLPAQLIRVGNKYRWM